MGSLLTGPATTLSPIPSGSTTTITTTGTGAGAAADSATSTGSGSTEEPTHRVSTSVPSVGAREASLSTVDIGLSVTTPAYDASRPATPSAGATTPKPAPAIGVATLACFVDRRTHGDNILQVAAAAGAADVVALFLDADPSLAALVSKPGGNTLLHYAALGHAQVADIFKAVRTHLLHDPDLLPLEDEVLHAGDGVKGIDPGSRVGSAVSIPGLGDGSGAPHQRAQSAPVRASSDGSATPPLLPAVPQASIKMTGLQYLQSLLTAQALAVEHACATASHITSSSSGFSALRKLMGGKGGGGNGHADSKDKDGIIHLGHRHSSGNLLEGDLKSTFMYSFAGHCATSPTPSAPGSPASDRPFGFSTSHGGSGTNLSSLTMEAGRADTEAGAVGLSLGGDDHPPRSSSVVLVGSTALPPPPAPLASSASLHHSTSFTGSTTSFSTLPGVLDLSILRSRAPPTNASPLLGINLIIPIVLLTDLHHRFPPRSVQATVEALLRRGTSVTKPNTFGKTPLDIAAKHVGQINPEETCAALSMGNILVEGGFWDRIVHAPHANWEEVLQALTPTPPGI